MSWEKNRPISLKKLAPIETIAPFHTLPFVHGEWCLNARSSQIPWRDFSGFWLALGGRGAGKTRLGAEFILGLVQGYFPFAGTQKYKNIALVGETLSDVRDVMIEGPSGIMTIARKPRPHFEPSRRRLVWDNGAVAHMFSSEDPDSLRGPQFDAAWCDEVAKWKNMESVFDMLQFGLRLGDKPCQVLTTTPRPVPLIKRLVRDPKVWVTHMKTGENAQNLSRGFMSTIEQRYGNTRLGRQELDGELIEDRVDALWNRAQLEQHTQQSYGPLKRVVVAIDPPASSHEKSDACGIVGAGIDDRGVGVILADASLKPAKPHQWAAKAARLYESLDADCIIVEANQGGDMAVSVLHAIDPRLPVRKVHASRGKWMRAEPIAALYEQGRVVHAARFAQLEDEMCDFAPDGLSSRRSPDRLDALVWALSELMLGKDNNPRIRAFSS